MPSTMDDRILFWDDQYDSILDWYFRNPYTGIYTQLRFAPGGDGQNVSLVGLNFKDILAKADMSSSVSGVMNPIYSLGVFINVIAQANAVSALPQVPWRRKGYRAITALSKSSALGIAEGATINLASDPVIESYVQVNPDPAEIRIVKRFTHRLAFLSQVADTVTINDSMREMEVAWRRSLDKDILQPVATARSNNFESLERIAGDDTKTADDATAADFNLYNLTRSSNTWSRGSVVDAGTGGAPLTIAVLDSLYQAQVPFYTEFPTNKVFVTGPNTLLEWSRLEAAKQRFSLEPVEFTIGDGLRLSGQRGGFVLSAFRGQPIIFDDQVASTGSGAAVDNILSLDYSRESGLPRVGVAWGRPPEYFENADPVVAGHAVVGGFYGIGQTYCVQFPSQGKIFHLT